MITDEQVEIACKRINERHSYTVASEKAMREVLETFERNKWKDTEESLPNETGNYATDVGVVFFFLIVMKKFGVFLTQLATLTTILVSRTGNQYPNLQSES